MFTRGCRRGAGRGERRGRREESEGERGNRVGRKREDEEVRGEGAGGVCVVHRGQGHKEGRGRARGEVDG